MVLSTFRKWHQVSKAVNKYRLSLQHLCVNMQTVCNKLKKITVGFLFLGHVLFIVNHNQLAGHVCSSSYYRLYFSIMWLEANLHQNAPQHPGCEQLR